MPCEAQSPVVGWGWGGGEQGTWMNASLRPALAARRAVRPRAQGPDRPEGPRAAEEQGHVLPPSGK